MNFKLRNPLNILKIDETSLSAYLSIGFAIPIMLGFLFKSSGISIAQTLYEIHHSTIPIYVVSFTPLFIFLSKDFKNKVILVYSFPMAVSFISTLFYIMIFYFNLSEISLFNEFISILNSLVLSYFSLLILLLPLIIKTHISDIKNIKNLNDEWSYKKAYIVLTAILVINIYALFFHHENYYNAQIYSILITILIYTSLYFYFLSRVIYQKNINKNILWINLLVFSVIIIAHSRIYNLSRGGDDVMYSLMLSISTISGFNPTSSDINMVSLDHIILQLQRVISVIIFASTGIIINSLLKRA